jgi:hypothetical protein
MSVKNTYGTVLIRESALLPAGLALKSEAFLPGWRIVSDIDAFELSRQIDEAHWTFFYLAGEMKAIVFGREQPRALRNALKRILAKRKTLEHNSLQITSVVSKTFLGIPFLTVKAVSRHVRESLYLLSASKAPDRISVTSSTPGIELNSQSRQRPVDILATEHLAEPSNV